MHAPPPAAPPPHPSPAAPEPVWLVRIVLLLVLIGFGIYVGRQSYLIAT